MRIARAAWAAAAVVSCGDAGPSQDGASRDDASRYLDGRGFRRAALVASLTTDDNDYARLRLARYESGDARDWSRLPAWNPPVAPVRVDDLATRARPTDALAIAPGASAGELPALRALGEAAFARYPAMLAAPGVDASLRTRAAAERYGFAIGADGVAVGLVRVALADGSVGLGYACAACHGALRADGSVAAGLANARLDLGALGADSNATLDPTVAALLRAWGPGRVDVATDDGREPVATPDLRAVREQRYLHRAGAVRLRSLASLAVRIETLLITAHHESVRPPREVALGLAVYLWSLGDALGAPAAGAATRRGEAVFAAHCARCHAPPSYAGGLVRAEDVGTDASIARSPARGTGAYRVPSLRGVGARALLLLHDGSAAGLDALLDPARTGGHAFGLDLPDDERRALRAFLATL